LKWEGNYVNSENSFSTMTAQPLTFSQADWTWQTLIEKPFPGLIPSKEAYQSALPLQT
jgi:hypothetical protein